jgi:hypothetical protein
MFKHPKTFTTDDFTEFDATENSNDFNLLAFLDIARGQAESLGRGFDSTQTDAEGRISAQVKDDAGAQVYGKLQLALLTPNNRVIRVINEWDLSEIDEPSSGERTDRYPFPIQEATEKGNRVYKSSPYRLGLLVKSDGSGSGTLSLANSLLKADGQRAERTQ